MFNNCIAQTESITIDTIGIVEKHLNIQSNTSLIQTERLANASSIPLGKALQSQTPLFIKSYGAGSISTISLRGGSASQTLLRWQNIPITNPMLGLNDVSLIPTFNFNEIKVNSTSSSTSSGSGAMTGVIDINNKPLFKDKLNADLNINYGAFNKKSLGTNLSYYKNKLGLKTAFIKTVADNNFTYTTTSGESKKQTHAYSKNQALTVSAFYFNSSASFFQCDLWVQNSFRQIPPTTTQNKSASDLTDDIYRYNISYQFAKNKITFKTQIAYLNEYNKFQDSLNLIFTNNHFQKILHISDIAFKYKNYTLNAGYNADLIQSSTDFYESLKELRTLGLYAKIKTDIKQHQVSFGLRKNWQTLSSIPLNPELTYAWDLFQGHKILAKISKEFRSPTSNELFWQPGGNENLLPETAWNQEINYNFMESDNKNNVNISLFHRTTTNWILWTLNPELNYFQATNIAKVKSYGVEFKHTFSWNKSEFYKHILQTNYAYVVSKNEKDISIPLISKGSQLFYTPMHKVALNYNLSTQHFSFNLDAYYTSNTIGIQSDIPGYFLTDLGIKIPLLFKKYNLDLEISISNLFNNNYRVIEKRPMPRRYFEFGIQFQL